MFAGPYASGAAGITADACARLGLRAGFAGAVGADGFGRMIVERLRADGVDVVQVREIEGEATGCAFVSYDAAGERRFIFHVGRTASGRVEATEGLAAYARGFRHCHVAGCSLAVNGSMREAVVLAAREVKGAGGTVSLDPNVRPELGDEGLRSALLTVLGLADVVLPSGGEARLLTGVEDADAACRRLVAGGARVVALKLGAAGCRVYTAQGEFGAAGFAVEAVDPTGAGDCFDAGFIAGWLEGRPLAETARLANALGALGASRRGPMEGARPRAEVEAFMASAGAGGLRV